MTANVILDHEPIVRLSFFFSILVIMATWETLAPRRPRSHPRFARWPSNMGIVLLNTLILRLLFPTAAVGLALIGEQREWGLFHYLQTPFWLAVALSVGVLDLAIYLQHVLFHAVPTLWRLHRMHHADLDFDVTTGARFHPLEIILSMLIKLFLVIGLGAPAVGVLIFEVLLNATSMFNHANAKLPLGLDRWLRLIIVTPDMHRVHHSIIPRETNSNFGFNLSLWDRLFGTYRPQPSMGHDGMTIGLHVFRDTRDLRLDRMLSQPFRRQTDSYPLGQREPQNTRR